MHFQFHYEHNLRSILIDRYITLELPKCQNITLSSTSKRLVEHPEEISSLLASLEMISGYKTKITRIKKSLAGFGVKESMVIGGQVGIPNEELFLFLDWFLLYVLPIVNKKRVLVYTDVVDIGLTQLTLCPQIFFQFSSLPYGGSVSIQIPHGSFFYLSFLIPNKS